MLLSIPNVVQSLQNRFNKKRRDIDKIEDIYDGVEYKNLCSEGQILGSQYNFTLLFYTDGYQEAKSSNMTAWPIYAAIMELPPHMRNKYMLLAGIFVNIKPPSMNNFLRPFIIEMRNLYKDGITWKLSEKTEVISKIIVVICSVSSPVRSALTRMVQDNDIYGCLHCYAEGCSIGPEKLVYPINQSFGRLRTHNALKVDMLKAHNSKTVKNGVKGISSLVGLPLFDISKSVIVESMHTVFLGVTKQHTILLLKNINTPYYIGNSTDISIIDNNLLSIKPPSQRSPAPRSIKSFVKWKASEWRNWLDYAPFCLKDILNVKYVNHFALLSEAIHYLNNDSITPLQLDRAEKLLIKYVKLFENYFGKENMSFDIHSLTHLVQSVRNWGPLWVHSAFITEAWNKKLIGNVTSSHSKAEQIVTRFFMTRFIDTIIFDSSISSETRKFINTLINTFEKVDDEKEENRFIGLGKSTSRLPTAEEQKALINAGFQPTHLTFFPKAVLYGTECSCKCEKTEEFDNSIVYFGNNTFGTIVGIAHFHNNDLEVSGIFINYFNRVGWAFNTNYIHQVLRTKHVIFINGAICMKPAFVMSNSEQPNSLYCIKIANK